MAVYCVVMYDNLKTARTICDILSTNDSLQF